MKRRTGGGFLALCMVLAGVFPAAAMVAQATQSITLNEGDAWHGRPYLLALGAHGIVAQTNWWPADGGGLQAYARAHPDASYLLFVQEGTLYRLDTAVDLNRLREQHEPLEHLASLQVELAASMAPLSAQQQTLGAEMRATRDPHLMGRIGHEQGVIGRRQGEIGRQQGVIGREQGLLARAFYQGTQELIDQCLQQKTCSPIASMAPASLRR